jgi:predicted peptidase
MHLLKKTLLGVMILLANTAFGQLRAVQDKAAYPFLLHLPADSILNNKPPVLIFLHGRSLSGTNLELVKKYGVMTEIQRGRSIPAIVAAPQVKAGESWSPGKLLSLLDYLQQTYHTDSSRVYVVGMSLGGYGTLHFAGKYPERITAAVALCGGGNASDCCNLATIPLWIQHGKLDVAVPISESEVMVKGIRACNGGKNLTYKVYDNYGHGELARVFSDDAMYKWLFQQKKG